MISGMADNDPEHAEACRWLEEYLDGLGLDYEYERDLGTVKRPDYLVTTPTGPIVCEVKAFRPQPFPVAPPGQGFYVRDVREVLATSRNSIQQAASQLAELAGRSFPLVVVLANPADAHVLLNQGVHAVYGDMQVVITGQEEDGSTTSQTMATRNGSLRSLRPYVSGVLVLNRVVRQVEALQGWQPSRRDLALEDFHAELNTYIEAITASGLRYPDVGQVLLAECRRLVLAMVAAWRWDIRDEFPDGHQHGREILSLLRQGPPWPALGTLAAE